MKQHNEDKPVFDEAVSQKPAEIAPGGILIGTVTGIDSRGQPLVDFPENTLGPLVAMSTLGITAAHMNRDVALLFANGDMRSPVIMGLIHNSLHDLILSYDPKSGEGSSPSPADTNSKSIMPDELRVDGKRVVLEGKEEVVIRCGDASITLTKSGKILIRGKYLLNRASGVNRIMGGSVQVN